MEMKRRGRVGEEEGRGRKAVGNISEDKKTENFQR